jgi:hypothetical protein
MRGYRAAGVYLEEYLMAPGTAHEHRLQRNPGGITCACGLDVRQPSGMPDYSRAGTGRWEDLERG